ncbi:LysR family transcriptional regulator, partial [Streptomyces sp. CHB9.2]|nr:LysR family transcriptional regulator [Streptomyces sp. CHB9.2]
MNSTFSHDRLDLLETFVRIVEAGSLSAAARQLGTTQPTVSRRLQALEAALQVRLVQRSTHALRLTEDGQRCYRQAQQLLGDWQAFAAALHG